MKNIPYPYANQSVVRFLLFLSFSLVISFVGTAQEVVILPDDGSASESSVPQDALRYQRQYYLITPAEMAASDVVNGNSLNALGFTLATAQDNVTEEITHNFGGAPFSYAGSSTSGTQDVNANSTTVSTLSVPALPAGAEILSATLKLIDVNAISPSYRSEFRVILTGAYSLGATQVSTLNSAGLVNPDPEIDLPSFPVAGGTINLLLSETYNDGGTDIDATVQSASIVVVYKVHGLLKLYLKNTTDTERQVDVTWMNTTSTTASKDLNGLSIGNYEWRVKVNGSSVYSDIKSFSSARPSECNQPDNLTTTSISPTSAIFNWTAPLSNGFTEYKVEYKKLIDATWTTPAPTTSKTYTATGLSKETAYQWRVSTVCGAESSYVIGTLFTTTDDFCGAVTGTASGPATSYDTTFTVQWNTTAGATRYELRYRRNGISSWNSASANSNVFTINGLATGTNYQWQVRAVCNNSGTTRKGVYSATSTFTTSGPTIEYPPVELKTNVKNETDFTLSWTAISGATSYDIQYRPKESVSWTTINADVDMTKVHDDYFEIPNITGPFSIPFSSPFAYTGGGLYIAWEYTRPDGALADLNNALATNTGIQTETDPNNQNQVLKSFFSFATEENENATAHRELLFASYYRPKTHVESNDLVDVAEVSVIHALGYHALSYASSATVSALVKNNSASTESFDVKLSVKDTANNVVAGPFTQTVSVNANSDQLVTFTNWLPTVAGTYSIIVSIPPITSASEGALDNNSKTYRQVVNSYILGYDDGSPSITSAGFGTDAGLLLNRHTMDGCGRINAAQIYLTYSTKGKSVSAVVYNTSGTKLDESASFTPGEEGVNRYHTFYFPNTPTVTNGNDFYIGLAQTASTDAYNPVGVQWETEDIRASAYYRADLNGTNRTDTPAPGRLMIRAEIIPNGSVPVINGDLTLCPANPSNTLTVSGESHRFAKQYTAYSIDGNAQTITTDKFSPADALGTPNVYPDYSTKEGQWKSNATGTYTTEIVTFSISGPAAPISFIDIYETFRKGTITLQVEAKNGGSWVVLTPTNTPTPISLEKARINRLEFAQTGFNVSEIRITVTSDVAVPGGTSIGIDAIRIGKQEAASFPNYLWTPNGETTSSITASATGIYTVTTDAAGCAQVASIEETDPIKPTISIGQNETASFCKGGSVTLTSSESAGVTWNPGGATTQKITITQVSASGSYTVTYDDGNCATASDPLQITVHPLPAVTITGINGICPGGSTTLDAGLFNNATYLWSTGATTQSISSVSTAGTYEVTVTDNNGCKGTRSANVFNVTPPAPVIQGDLQFCPGNTGVLSAGNFSNSTYLWSTGATTSTINNTAVGNFSVTVTDQYTCTGSNSAVVSHFPVPTPQITGGTLCAGNIAVLELAQTYNSYLWSTGATTNSISVNTPDNYSVTVTNSFGCTGSAAIPLVQSNGQPNSPGPITGPAGAACGQTNLTYTIDPVPNSTHYVWHLPPGMTDVSNPTGTTTLTVNVEADFVGGYIVVSASNECGQSPASNPTFINVNSTATDDDGDGICASFDPDDNDPCNPNPSAFACNPCQNFNPFISGNLEFCERGTVRLDAGSGYATYEWSTGETTQRITVATADVFTVSVTDSYGCSGSVSVTTTINGEIPATPGPITGPAGELCNATNVNFSIAPVPFATYYVWTVPDKVTIVSGQGTTTLTVDIEPDFLTGDIKVAASNACGKSPSTNPSYLTIATTDVDGDGVCASLDPDDYDGCVPVPTSPACNPCSILDEEGFETDFGIWNDGGINCDRVTNNANTGEYSVRLRGFSELASMHTNSLDLSAYTDLNFEFSFYAVSMEANEDFYLEISPNGGLSYSVYKQWNSGVDFMNDTRYYESFTISYPFTNNTRFRFRNDASNNTDQVFIDDVVIEACNISCTIGAPCNDGDDCTINDVYSSNCNCAGTYIDDDGDGYCVGDDPDDNDPCNPDANAPACNPCVIYIEDSYEFNFGNWNDGGNDCSRQASYPNTGVYSVKLRDDSGVASSMYSNALDLSAYTDVNLQFSYYAESMEADEDFFLEISTDDGATYTLYQEWNSGVEFVNDTRYDEALTIVYPFTNLTRFRLRCDASNPNDAVYIDDVIVSSCYIPPANAELNNRNPNAFNESTESVEADDIYVYPTPASNMLNINVQAVSGEEGKVIIYNLQGIDVLNYEFEHDHPTVLAIPTHQLESGLYFLKVQSGQKAFKVKRVVIVR